MGYRARTPLQLKADGFRLQIRLHGTAFASSDECVFLRGPVTRGLFVPGGGLEPPRVFSPTDFESAASTNFAIPAYGPILGGTGLLYVAGSGSCLRASLCSPTCAADVRSEHAPDRTSLVCHQRRNRGPSGVGASR